MHPRLLQLLGAVRKIRDAQAGARVLAGDTQTLMGWELLQKGQVIRAYTTLYEEQNCFSSISRLNSNLFWLLISTDSPPFSLELHIRIPVKYNDLASNELALVNIKNV